MAEEKIYNILILGETGVGKSTFINAFVNYVNFPTLDIALNSEKIHALIPSRFTITDSDFNSKEIKFGEDKNESFKIGESSTQHCRTYRIRGDDVTIRLIDTPGIGDTRGVHKDEENFANLVSYLGEFKEISAIAIMLKPNEARVTVLFEYCIKQLLSSLERSAVKNIIFLFTNARGTFYRPGDTVGPLKSVLKEIEDTPPHVKVAFNSKNTFCFDNEAFRFLIAKREGYVFDDDAKQAFERSWNTSMQVCKNMIKYIIELKPHPIQNTVSVMDARRTIERLRKPLGEITELVENNIARMVRLEENLMDANKTIEEKVKFLNVKRINLRVTKLEHPRTVCAATQCTEVHKIEDSTKVHYKIICHKRCYLDDVPKEVRGDHRLQSCVAMQFKNGIATCWVCGHEYLQHMHIYYTTEPYDEIHEDKNVAEQISNKKVEVEDIEKELNRYRQEKAEYEKERETIQKAVAKFAHFLSNSVIIPYNDAYKEYLLYLIEKEKKLGNLAKQDAIANFNNLIKRYEEEKNELMRALAEVKKQDSSVKTVVSANEVMNIIKELYGLKLTGKTIKEMYDAQQRHTAAEIVKKTETIVEPISLKTAVDVVKNVGNWFLGSFQKPKVQEHQTTMTTTTTTTTTRTMSSSAPLKTPPPQ